MHIPECNHNLMLIVGPCTIAIAQHEGVNLFRNCESSPQWMHAGFYNADRASEVESDTSGMRLYAGNKDCGGMPGFSVDGVKRDHNK